MPPAADDRDPPEPGRGARRWRPSWLALAFLVVAIPLIAVNANRGRAQFDQAFFHEPTIRTFAADWPAVDLSNYLSATAPGYHLALAAIARFFNDDLAVLRICGAMFTVALLWLLESAVRRRLAVDGTTKHVDLRALALAAPVLCSMYVLLPGIWLNPDNAGWLGVLVVMLFALRPRWDAVSVIGGGLALLALVWMRQSHVWAAGMLWVAAWVSTGPARNSPSDGAEGECLKGQIAWFVRPTAGRLRRLGAALLASLPALLSLVVMWRLWGGLTPAGPGGQFRSQHDSGFNPAAGAFALAVLGVLGAFFAAWAWPGLAALWRDRRRGGRAAVILATLFGLALAIIPPTTYVYEARATGLWNVVKVLDQRGLIIAGRTSPLMLLLAPAGAIGVVALVSRLPRRHAWTLGLALAGFVLAQSANANAWQRYFEPMLLIWLALACASAAGSANPTTDASRPTPRWLATARWAGPALLAALFAALSAYVLATSEVPVKSW